MKSGIERRPCTDQDIVFVRTLTDPYDILFVVQRPIRNHERKLKAPKINRES